MYVSNTERTKRELKRTRKETYMHDLYVCNLVMLVSGSLLIILAMKVLNAYCTENDCKQMVCPECLAFGKHQKHTVARPVDVVEEIKVRNETTKTRKYCVIISLHM